MGFIKNIFGEIQNSKKMELLAEEKLYEHAAREVDSGDIRQGLWLKASSHATSSHRDDIKREYIRLRVEELLADGNLFNQFLAQITESEKRKEAAAEAVAKELEFLDPEHFLDSSDFQFHYQMCLAIDGDANAQYSIAQKFGLMTSEGYSWLCIAASFGHKEARTRRDSAYKQMQSETIERSLDRAEQMFNVILKRKKNREKEEDGVRSHLGFVNKDGFFVDSRYIEYRHR